MRLISSPLHALRLGGTTRCALVVALSPGPSPEVAPIPYPPPPAGRGQLALALSRGGLGVRGSFPNARCVLCALVVVFIPIPLTQRGKGMRGEPAPSGCYRGGRGIIPFSTLCTLVEPDSRPALLHLCVQTLCVLCGKQIRNRPKRNEGGCIAAALNRTYRLIYRILRRTTIPPNAVRANAVRASAASGSVSPLVVGSTAGAAVVTGAVTASCGVMLATKLVAKTL